MKRILLAAFAFGTLLAAAQPNISSWHLNTTGAKGSYWTTGGTKVTMADSSGIIRLCYTSTSVYLKGKGLADNYTMGANLNPFVPVAQTYTFKIPKNPSQQTGTQTTVPGGGSVGLAVNGVVFFGSRDADSYKSSTNSNAANGDGIWHGDAWYNEGSSMDTSGSGHSTASGAYHYHATPITLYSDPSTSHSPIIGYALDGYPIYGPFGYSVATNSSSSITRMTSSYQLRSITTRTVLPDGSASSPAGPPVSTAFPLGMYVEDYEYISGLGELDELNGRYCVTPEYPSGTYAYFISTDASGNPAYPYILANNYYGVTSPADMGPNVGNATIPSTGTTCVTTVTGISNVGQEAEEILIYPNPSADKVNIEVKNNVYKSIMITDLLGQVISEGSIASGKEAVSVAFLQSGVYFIKLTDADGNSKAIRFLKE